MGNSGMCTSGVCAESDPTEPFERKQCLFAHIDLCDCSDIEESEVKKMQQIKLLAPPIESDISCRDTIDSRQLQISENLISLSRFREANNKYRPDPMANYKLSADVTELFYREVNSFGKSNLWLLNLQVLNQQSWEIVLENLSEALLFLDARLKRDHKKRLPEQTKNQKRRILTIVIKHKIQGGQIRLLNRIRQKKKEFFLI